MRLRTRENSNKIRYIRGKMKTDTTEICSIIRDYYEQLQGFPGGSVVKNPTADAGVLGDTDSIPGLGRYPGGGNGNPL